MCTVIQIHVYTCTHIHMYMCACVCTYHVYTYAYTWHVYIYACTYLLTQDNMCTQFHPSGEYIFVRPIVALRRGCECPARGGPACVNAGGHQTIPKPPRTLLRPAQLAAGLPGATPARHSTNPALGGPPGGKNENNKCIPEQHPAHCGAAGGPRPRGTPPVPMLGGAAGWTPPRGLKAGRPPRQRRASAGKRPAVGRVRRPGARGPACE